MVFYFTQAHYCELVLVHILIFVNIHFLRRLSLKSSLFEKIGLNDSAQLN